MRDLSVLRALEAARIVRAGWALANRAILAREGLLTFLGV